MASSVLWGGVGWGLFSAVARALIDAAGLQAGFAAILLLALPLLRNAHSVHVC